MEITPQNIMFGIGIISVLFSVFLYFKNPQIRSEKNESLLAQRVQWEREETDKRFTALQNAMLDATKLAQNHIHTIDTKVESLHAIVNNMGQEIVKLGTIIEERMPKK